MEKEIKMSQIDYKALSDSINYWVKKHEEIRVGNVINHTPRTCLLCLLNKIVGCDTCILAQAGQMCIADTSLYAKWEMDSDNRQTGEDTEETVANEKNSHWAMIKFMRDVKRRAKVTDGKTT